MVLDFPEQINFLSVLAGTILYFLLGMLWYSPLLFGKIWSQYIILTEEDKKGMGLLNILSFISTFIISLTMAVFIQVLLLPTWIFALKISLLAGLGFMFLPMFINGLYNKKPMQVMLVDAGYHLCWFVILSLILSLWPW